jgi:hypothetical protein
MPIIPPNNTTGLYGIDTTVSIGNTLFATNLNISGNAAVGNNITAGGQISAAGNITAGSGSYFLGDGSLLSGIASNYGNVDVANYLANFGSNVITTTGNITAGNLIPTGNLVGNVVGTLIQSPGIANVRIKSAAPSSDLQGNGIYLDSSVVYVGNVIGRLTATPSVDFTLAAQGTTSAEITLTQTGGTGIRGGTGNIDIRASGSAGNDPFRIVNGNINMAGNVYIGGYGYQTSPNSWGNLQVNGNIRTNSAISAVGNITGNYILGNGSALTGIVATASPAGSNTELQFNDAGSTGASANLTFNKSTNVLATTAISATGNITGNYFVGNGSLLTGIAGSYGNSDVSNYLASGTNTANIITTGNVSGNYILGNGSQLTGLPATYGNADVSNYLASGTNTSNIITTGNIAASNVRVGSTSAFDSTSTKLEIGGWNAVPRGRLVSTYISPHSDLAVIEFTKPSTTTGPADANIVVGNITSNGTMSAIGNIRGGNLTTGGQVSATGNISTAGRFQGDGSEITGIVAGTDGGIQFNAGGFFGTSPNLRFDTANNIANIANLTIQGSIINNINPFNAADNPNPFRIIYGNGYNGDYGSTTDPLGAVRNSLLTIQTKQTSTTSDTNHGVRGYSGITYNDLNGQTHTNNTRRGAGSGSVLWLGNGSIAMTGTQYLGASGAGGTVIVGNVGTVSMGNATIGHATGALNLVLGGAGANIGNAVGTIGQIQFQATNANVTTAIAVGTQFTATATPTTPPTTVIGYYMPNTTATYGLSSSNSFRGATNYYFLRNDDAVAQNQLGSLRSYTEFNGVSGTTSGSLTIDKANGQVQQVNLTGNISGITYSNFVSSASDGTNTDEQSDTVTIVFNQGATGNYGITFPTGSTYLYAGNVKALQSVAANSVSLVSVSAVRIGGTTTYLTTISPGFVQ